MLICGSRGALLGIIAGGGILIGLKGGTQRWMLAVLGASIVLTIAVILLGRSIGPNTGFSERYGIERFVQDKDTMDDRSLLWEAAVSDFLARPIVGRGIGSFSSNGRLGTLESREYPHNVFLESAAECGIVGLILVVLSTMSPLVWLRKRRMWRSEEIFCFSIWIFGFINAQLSGDFVSNPILWAGAGFMALIGQTTKDAQKSMV